LIDIEKVKKKKQKKSTTAKRLDESNNSAACLVALGKKKINMKSEYYKSKLEILREKNSILQRIAVALENQPSIISNI